MKLLHWLKENMNFVSVLVGLGFVVSGKAEIGQILISQGGNL